MGSLILIIQKHGLQEKNLPFYKITNYNLVNWLGLTPNNNNVVKFQI